MARKPKIPGMRQDVQPPYGGADDGRWPGPGPARNGLPPHNRSVHTPPHSLRDPRSMKVGTRSPNRPGPLPPAQPRQPQASPPSRGHARPVGGKDHYHAPPPTGDEGPWALPGGVSAGGPVRDRGGRRK
jgi:hypothetical protein